MATSGAYDFVNVEVADLVTDAFQRIGIVEERLNGMLVASARRSLNLILSDWSNRNLNVWTVEKRFLHLNENQRAYDLPSGTVDVLEVLLRDCTRPTGTATSSAGGTAASAFDDIFTTACTQTSTNGRLYLDYGSGLTEKVQFVGLRSSTTTTYNFILEVSDDASTWTTVKSIGSTSFTAAVSQWFEIDQPNYYRYFSVRESGGATMSLTEAYFMSEVVDKSLGRISRSAYTSVGQKFTPGTPSTFHVTRGLTPQLTLYPPPTIDFPVLMYNRVRHLYDVTAATETFDMPQRFLEAITSALAWRLAQKFAVERTGELRAEAMDAFGVAAAEDRDRAPMSITPDFSGMAG